MQNEVILKDLINDLAPDLEYEILNHKGFIDSLPTSVVIAAEAAIVAFPFLWKIFLVWLERYTNGKVTIKYKTGQGKEVTVEYSKLNKSELEELLANEDNREPIIIRSPVKIDFENE